jgi:uncharacterized membrane protein
MFSMFFDLLELLLWLFGLALGVSFLAMPVLSILLWRKMGHLRERVRGLEYQLQMLLETEPLRTAGEEVTPEEQEVEPEVVEDAAFDEVAETVEEPPEAPDTEEGEQAETAEETGPAVAAPTTRPTGSFEQSLTSRWLVWLGGVALALGGAFLVKYTIDEGLLGPGVRIALGVLFSIALIVGGEWLRRRPLQQAMAAISPDYVPPALTAAGVASLYTTIFAAFALYDMMPALLAFVLMAAVSVGAAALALLQGPFIAVLGIFGGYATPLLVSTGHPMAYGLFPYIFLLTAASMWLVRYMGAWWLAWLAFAGAMFWPLLWLAGIYQYGDTPALGVYLLATSALFIFLRRGAADTDPAPTMPFLPRAFQHPETLLVWVTVASTAFLLFVLVRVDGYGTFALSAIAAAAAGMLLVARREPVFESFAVIASVMVLFAAGLWHLPEIITVRPPLFFFDQEEIGKGIGPVVPPELLPFLGWSGFYALILAGGGFAGLWGARRAGLWAGVSAATPVIMMALAYWRIRDFEVDFAWALASLLLGAVLVVGAGRTNVYRPNAGMTAATGAYAAGTVAALSLAMVMSLENAWLTVALAIQTPVLAWIEERLDLRPLRRVAMVLAGIVLVRLALNFEVLEYGLSTTPIFNWLIYGYGVPAVSCFVAAWKFRQRGDDYAVNVLEAAALVLFVLLVSLEVRHLMTGGDLRHHRYGLMEQGIQSLSWLCIAVVLYGRHGYDGRLVGRWGWRVLVAAALFQIVVFQLVLDNPILVNRAVGVWPILNALLFAYFAPAIAFAAFAVIARRRGDRLTMLAAGGLALVLMFVWVNLEVRHAFHGNTFAYGRVSDAEGYSYSAAWIVYAGILLGLGLWRQQAVLRHASLVLVLATVVKVFAIDMAALSGIYRALSFMGLGLALVAVGWLYRRFVYGIGGEAAEGPETDEGPAPSGPEGTG